MAYKNPLKMSIGKLATKLERVNGSTPYIPSSYSKSNTRNSVVT